MNNMMLAVNCVVGLQKLLEEGKEESTEAEQFRSQLDEIWLVLNPEEKELIKTVSEKLFG